MAIYNKNMGLNYVEAPTVGRLSSSSVLAGDGEARGRQMRSQEALQGLG